MSEGMKTARHAAADIGRIARAQWWFVGRSRRRELIGMGVLAVILIASWTFTLASMSERIGETPGQMHLAALMPVVLFLALLWPKSVWHREGPDDRRYHGSMPIDRRIHDLLRIGAGVAWYYLILAGIVLSSALIEWAVGYESYVFNGTPWIWVALIVTPLIPYMIGTTFAILSERPIVWMIGIYLAYGLSLTLIGYWLGEDSLQFSVVAAPITGEYGLGDAIGHGAGLIMLGQPVTPLVPQWLAAAGIWLAITGTLMLLAVQRHPSMTLANPAARAWLAWRGANRS